MSFQADHVPTEGEWESELDQGANTGDYTRAHMLGLRAMMERDRQIVPENTKLAMAYDTGDDALIATEELSIIDIRIKAAKSRFDDIVKSLNNEVYYSGRTMIDVTSEEPYRTDYLRAKAAYDEEIASLEESRVSILG